MNVRLKITVCRDCTGRYPACHDSCPKYLEQKAKRRDEGNKIWAAKREDLMLDSVHLDAVKRTKRKVGMR